MVRRSLFLIIFCFSALFMAAEPSVVHNRYPLVLVGGFMNFGRDEALGFHYWGGMGDIQSFLLDRGYTVYTADVGPLSSNWDRACELFAEIKGGRVDYGAQHSKKYGHERFGKICTGFYPEWGTLDPETGGMRKIHLVCHSMGGQTARVLAHLLEEGSGDEQESGGSDCSPLFTGGHSWVESVTTIATPHDGTTLARAAPYFDEYAVLLLAMLDGANKITGDVFFDFQLDHWGLILEPDDSILDVREKLESSRLWEKTDDFSLFDLTPEGAMELNRNTPASENIYYFSWSTEQTTLNIETGRVKPEIGLNPGLLPGALFMGEYEIQHGDPQWIDYQWRMNDGVVNTISMAGPKAGSDDDIRLFNGAALRGVWNDMGIISSCDHFDIIGIMTDSFGSSFKGYTSVEQWYLDLADFLRSLE